jgi:3-hydroxyisobutyrate dehydrogenase-like beta-hydroxyacid dehydrogenase
LRRAHNEQIFNRHKPVLDAMGDLAAYIGPIGAGTIAKLVHNCTSAVMGVALAEVFTMGIKAGVEPLDLWEAVRQGATGRRRTFDRLGRFLSGQHDPADFALRLLHKDVGLGHCASYTRMSGSGARSECRCGSPTWPLRN